MNRGFLAVGGDFADWLDMAVVDPIDAESSSLRDVLAIHRDKRRLFFNLHSPSSACVSQSTKA